MKKLFLLLSLLFASAAALPSVSEAQVYTALPGSKWEWQVPGRACTVVLTLGTDMSYRVDTYCKSGRRYNQQTRVGTFGGTATIIDINVASSTCVGDWTHYLFQYQLNPGGVDGLRIMTAFEDANFVPVALDKQYFTAYTKRLGCFQPMQPYYTPGASGFVYGNLLPL
jgi:hypothetical protein